MRFDPDFYRIVEEKHADGSPHLHALVKFKAKFSKAFVLKHFKEIFPDDYKRIDVQPVRSVKHAHDYLSKEDKEPLESGSYLDPRGGNLPSIIHLKNTFATELGFKDYLSWRKHMDDHEDYCEKSRSIIHSEYLYFLQYPSFNLSHKSSKIFENLFAKNCVSKDDITFLKMELGISDKMTDA